MIVNNNKINSRLCVLIFIVSGFVGNPFNSSAQCVVKLVTQFNFIRKHTIEFMRVNVFVCFRRRRRPVRDELEQDAKQEECEKKWQQNRVKTINL